MSEKTDLKKQLQADITVLLLFLLMTSPLVAQFYSFETPKVKIIYYDKQHEYVVPHLARCYENSFKFHQNLFNYHSGRRTILFMQDLNDYGHGGTSTMPWNFLNIGMESFDYAYETRPANERMNWLMHHELAHMVTIDKATSFDNFFRTLFGGKILPDEKMPLTMLYSYLTNPRWYSPRWYHEGIAVFLETWMAGGYGRALGGYDEMVFRTMVRDSSYFYDVVGLESEGTTIDFQIGTVSYLYGTRFVCYLANKYSPQRVIEWYDRSKGSKRYFTSQFKKVFKISLDDEWSNWTRWEHEWQQANLDSIRKYPVTPFRPVIERALGSVSRAFYDSTGNSIYTAVVYPGQISHIASIELNTGKIKKICNVPTPALYYVTFLAYDPDVRKIFYTTDNSRGWRDLNAVDLNTGKNLLLLKNDRTGDLVLNLADKSLWGVQHHNGKSAIVRFPPPYKNWQVLLTLPYGRDIYDLDISPDGKYLSAAYIQVSGRVRLIRMKIEELLKGNSSFEVLHEFENSTPENFVFSRDGKFLLGSSYYTGISNIWRYDIDNKKMEILSNCESGFFRPLEISNDYLMVFRYTGQGFQPVLISAKPLEDVSAVRYLGQEIVKNHPVVKDWLAPRPSTVELDSSEIKSGSYVPWKNIKPAWAFPIIEGYKDFVSVGIQTDFMDLLAFHHLKLSASYTPRQILQDGERVHLGFQYSYWPWEFRAAYNRADFYDLFGPTKTSRKGYSAGIRYNRFFINEKPKTLEYTIDLAGYGGLERLPDYQNVSASFKEFLAFSANLNYSYLLRSLGAVEYEQGVAWQLTTRMNYVNSKAYPGILGELNWGVLLPLNHSSIWVRSFAGYSAGKRTEPFANFYFGGFGNNWIDYQEISRYRNYYSFPGVELNEIGGTNYGRVMLEWTVPPLNFRRVGTPSFFLRWARLALFSSGITTNFDSNEYRTNYLNLGGQLDFRFVLFSHLDSTFSLGFARAFEERSRPSNEFMISLKIL